VRIIVIGVGPIGGIIGGRLARAGNDITFVDIDQEHIAAIRQTGLRVDVPDGPFTVNIKVVLPREVEGKYDLALIAVRSNYTPAALDTAMAHLADDGVLVSMQNGINPPLLEQRVGADRAIGMAIRMGSRKVAPGHLQAPTRGHLYIGHLHGRTTPQLETFHGLVNRVMETEITDNIL
jgi:2-dehydropantoate 2-reductase